MRQGLLEVKLDELRRALTRLEIRTRDAQSADDASLHAQIEALQEECRAWEEALNACAREGRQEELRRLAQWELRLCDCAEKVLPEKQDAEMATLRAEFAIDAAVQAAARAQLAALTAIEQTRTQERLGEER